MVGFIYLCAVFFLVALFVLFFRNTGIDLCCAANWIFVFIIFIIVIFCVLFMFAFSYATGGGLRGIL